MKEVEDVKVFGEVQKFHNQGWWTRKLINVAAEIDHGKNVLVEKGEKLETQTPLILQKV